MENASKALLIAGSVLIVILLIGVGMLIYNSSGGIFNNARDQMSALEISTFNQQFEDYKGTNKTKRDVENLFAKVRTNNLTAENKVKVNDNEVSNTTSLSGTTTATKYTIDFEYDATGLISNIKITPNTAAHSLSVSNPGETGEH